MNNIAKQLLYEKNNNIKKRLYEFTVVKMTYESNKIEGSTLTLNETSELYNENKIRIIDRKSIEFDEIMEAKNHFRAFAYILDNFEKNLDEKFLKKLYFLLFENTHSNDVGFAIGDYKKKSNTIGSIVETEKPENVEKKVNELLQKYDKIQNKKIEDIIDFHYFFEKIHPFQDGNGRVGRLIMFKECLKNDIVPFIVSEEEKQYYIRGLTEYENEKGFLRETCLHFQDEYKKKLEYFDVEF